MVKYPITVKQLQKMVKENNKIYIKQFKKALKGKTPEEIDNFWNIQVKSLFQTSNVSLADTWKAEEELFNKEKENKQ